MFKNVLKFLISFISKPTPTPTPTPTPNKNIIDQLLILHNDHRKSLGLQPLKLNNLLNQAAQNHSIWMNQNNNLSHNEKFIDPGSRLKNIGYNWITYGENIALGYRDSISVFKGWLNSKGHRKNIENYNFIEVGFGLSGSYWTACFAKPK